MTGSTGNILAKQVAVDEFITTVIGYAKEQGALGGDEETVAYLAGFLEMCKVGHFATLTMEEYMADFRRRFPQA